MTSSRFFNRFLSLFSAACGVPTTRFERWLRANEEDLFQAVDGVRTLRERPTTTSLERFIQSAGDRLDRAARTWVQQSNLLLKRAAARKTWKAELQAVEADARGHGEDHLYKLRAKLSDWQTDTGSPLARAFEEDAKDARREDEAAEAREKKFAMEAFAASEAEAAEAAAEAAANEAARVTDKKKPIILVSLPVPPSAPGLLLSPYDYLSRDRFGEYYEACAGLKFVDKQLGGQRMKGNTGTLEAVAASVAILQKSGFEVVAHSQEAAERLAEGVRLTNKLVDDADAHLARIVASLAPRGLKPRPYQLVGIRWLRATVAGALLDVMGLGKTMQCLLAIGDRGIVMCPATVKDVWDEECRVWRPDLKPVVMTGLGTFRWPDKGEFLIYNFEMVRGERPVAAPWDGKVTIDSLVPNAANKIVVQMVSLNGARSRTFKLPAGRVLVKHGQVVKADTDLYQHHDDIAPAGPAPTGVCLVLDEAQHLKNYKSTRSRAAQAVATAVGGSGGHRWLCTATPICNRPRELQTLLEIIGAFGTAFKDRAAFSKAFGGKIESNNAVPTAEAAQMLARVALRRTKTDVFKDLPPVTFENRRVTLEGEALAVATELEEMLRPAVEAAEEEAVAAGKTPLEIAKAIEMAMGRQKSIGAMARARAMTAIARLPMALEIADGLEDLGEPVFVITTHREVCDVFGARPGWAKIMGGVSLAKRTEIVRAFQNGELKGVVSTIKSGGTGITLTRGFYGIAVDLWWNPAENEQAFARIDPARGRPEGVEQGSSTWYLCQDDSWIDEKVRDLVKLKSSMIAATVAPVAELGGTLPEGTRLSAVKVMLPASASTRSAPPHWLTDPHTLARVKALAADKDAPSFATWLAARIAEVGAIPPYVREKSVLEELESYEVQIEKKRRRRAKAAEPVSMPTSPHQQFAMDSLLQLAGLDPDRARHQNGVGFGGSTQDGHRLASLLRAGLGLGATDWRRAIVIANIHHRQVGKFMGHAEALSRHGRREVAACRDDVREVDDGHGAMLVRTSCGYEPERAEDHKQNIGRWRPHLKAWKATLDLKADKLGLPRDYETGLLFCQESKALTTSGIGPRVVYLQPEFLQEAIDADPDPYAVAQYLAGAADHEIAHWSRMGSGHSEAYIADREEIGARTGALTPQVAVFAKQLMRALPRPRRKETLPGRAPVQRCKSGDSSVLEGCPRSCCASCAVGHPCEGVENLPAVEKSCCSACAAGRTCAEQCPRRG